MADVGAWNDLAFFKDDWPGIQDALARDTRNVLPPKADLFKALQLTQPDDTRVIILGQDPYPTPGHAMGLAFSVTPSTKLPKSLVNIFKEMNTDLGQSPLSGDLTHWAQNGVMLLNTALSVPAHEAGGHARLGWHRLTEQVLTHLNDRPRAAVLWGKHAQSFAPFLSNPGHLILGAPHPSPLSAYRGFFGSRPFSQINTWLTKQGDTPVPWV